MKRTVPLSMKTGLSGWTSCCDASTRIDEHGTLYCKGCYNQVVHDPIFTGPEASALDRIIADQISGKLTAAKAIYLQKKLLGGN